jgi:hypothetical protein
MNTLNRFKASLAAATLVALPILSNGCSAANAVQNGQAALCCTEFKPGAAVDVKIGGSVQAQVAVQAIADFTGVVNAAIGDITTACRGLASDLGAAPADLDKADATTDPNPDNRAANDPMLKMQAYCSLAVTTIGTIKGQAGGTLSINVTPPMCSASLSAKANCEASCQGGVKCDFKAHPPVCTGGSLSVACKGECDAKAGASLNCTGTCTGGCTGSCTAMGGVDCAGKCDGTCTASAKGGSGIQADGTCKGSCSGTCQVTLPSATCTGSCSGKCDAKCTGTAMASVTCDGDCKADFEPLKCTGGKLEGGCNADVKCSGNCDASVQAKAECTPPAVNVTFAGAADFTAAGKLQAAFEANLPLVYAFQARLKALADLTTTITGNADVVADIKISCLPIVIASAATAVANLGATVTVTGNLVGAVTK